MMPMPSLTLFLPLSGNAKRKTLEKSGEIIVFPFIKLSILTLSSLVLHLPPGALPFFCNQKKKKKNVWLKSKFSVGVNVTLCVCV